MEKCLCPSYKHKIAQQKWDAGYNNYKSCNWSEFHPHLIYICVLLIMYSFHDDIEKQNHLQCNDFRLALWFKAMFLQPLFALCNPNPDVIWLIGPWLYQVHYEISFFMTMNGCKMSIRKSLSSWLWMDARWLLQKKCSLLYFWDVYKKIPYYTVTSPITHTYLESIVFKCWCIFCVKLFQKILNV